MSAEEEEDSQTLVGLEQQVLDFLLILSGPARSVF